MASKYDSDIVGWCTKNGKRIPIRKKKGEKKNKEKDAVLNGRVERQQALERFNEMYKNQKHTPEEESAKEEYMMNSDELNEYLRDGGHYHENKTIDTIKRSLHYQEDDLEVYRGVDGALFGLNATDTVKEAKKKLVGTSFRDRAFLSASLSKDVALEFSSRGYDGNYEAIAPSVMVINTNGLFTTLVNSGLAEVLLGIAQGGHLNITDVKKKGGVFYIFAEYGGI